MQDRTWRVGVRSYSQIQSVKLEGPRDGRASRTSTTSEAKRTNVACFTGGGVGDNTSAFLLFPSATIGYVMLITRIQFSGVLGLGRKEAALV